MQLSIDPHGCLTPCVVPPGDTKLRHVRKQAQLHPHEGSLLCGGGPIQVRWGGFPSRSSPAGAPLGCATMWPSPPRAQHPPSPPQVSLCALPAVPRHAVVPLQRGVLGDTCPLPTSSRISPVSDGRVGPACVQVCRSSRWTSLLWYCTVCVCVCVLKAAVRPFVPCPPCPAWGWRAGTGPEHLTPGHGVSPCPPAAPRHAWGAQLCIPPPSFS